MASGVTLDHEEKAAYALTAQVWDGRNDDGNAETVTEVDDTIEVSITVENVEGAARAAHGGDGERGDADGPGSELDGRRRTPGRCRSRPTRCSIGSPKPPGSGRTTRTTARPPRP